MDEQAVDGFERDLGQVLVRAMDRVARLEADDAAPAALGELGPCLRRILRQLGEGRLRALEHGHAARKVQRLLLVQPCDPGMRLVGGAKRLLCLALLVVLVGLLDLEHREELAALIRERDPVTLRRSVDRKTDGQRPRQAVREPHRVSTAS